VMRAMIDIETMDTRPSAVMVQIGAVLFDVDTGYISAPLLLDVDDTALLGGTTSRATVGWWARQGGFQHTGAPMPVGTALRVLASFCAGVAEVWAKGPAFDFPILDFYAERTEVPLSWKFYQVRDVRTIVSIAESMGFKVPHDKVSHRADEDAALQARNVINAYRHIWERKNENTSI